MFLVKVEVVQFNPGVFVPVGHLGGSSSGDLERSNFNHYSSEETLLDYYMSFI